VVRVHRGPPPILVTATWRKAVDHTFVSRRPLEVIRSTEVRSVFKRALKAELKKLGFKTARDGPTGWAREVLPIRDFFWIQFNPYGFLRDAGGKFIVEFEFHNSARRTAIRDRMWRLLDDASRREVVRLNNQAINALPGPLPELYGQEPDRIDETWQQRFEPIIEIPSTHSDVWFRYATRIDVDNWAGFLASRLGSIIVANEERLNTMPEGAAILLGTIRKQGEERWTDLDT
jgi:hypothetical protein